MSEESKAVGPAARVLSRRRFVHTTLAIVGAGLGSSLLAACGGGQTSGAPPSKQSDAGKPAQAPAAAQMKNVTLRFNWTAKGEFAPFYVAEEKGFYKEQNIQVELGEGKSGTQAAQTVGSGNDHFGYIPSIQVIQGVNQGIPLKSVAVCGRNTGMCWASRQDVPLDGPKALEGRKVSISTASTFFQVWEAFARKFNVDKGKVEAVQADPSARVGLFMNRQVDIMADIFFASAYVILQSQVNEPLNLLKISDLDFDRLGYLLVANNSVLEGDRELVRGFVQASVRGFRHMLDQPAEATELMVKLYGDRLGKEVLEGQVKQLQTLINTEPALGKADNSAWERSLDILQESGVIDKKLGLAEYFSNEFVEG